MADETIKSFLVSLGWDSQDAQQRKFIAAIKGATLRAKLLGDALEEVARKVGTAVTGMAEDFEQLYYHVERTGASAKDLTAFQYAVSQLGGTAEGAAASFETMAQKLRENPGNIALLNKMGIELDGVSGKLRFNAELAAQNAASMNIYTAEQYRALTGMDEKTFLAIRNHIGDLARFMAEKKEAMRLSSFDPDIAAKNAVRFEQTWRDIFMRVGVVGEAFGADLMKDLTGPLTSLDDFLKTHQAEISKALAAFSEGFGEVAKESVIAFEAWSKDPKTLDNIKSFFSDAAAGARVLGTAIAAVVDSLKYLVQLNEDSKNWWLFRLLNGAIGAENKGAENFRRNFTGNAPGGSAQSWLDASGAGDAPFGGKDSAVRVNGQPVSSSNPMPVTLGQKDKMDAEWGGGGASIGDAARRGGSLPPDGPAIPLPDTRTFWERHAPKAMGGKDAPTTKTGPTGVAYTAKSLTEAMGISQREYDAFREGLTDIEGKKYNRMGGAGGHYAGRYQMGPNEITDTARRLGVPRPSNEQFLADPAMQEKFFENYTLEHYRELLKNPKFAAMSHRQQLQILGYAHNQGVGSRARGNGAMGYIDSGRTGADAWGTSGTAYFGPIGRRYDAAMAKAAKEAQSAPAPAPAPAPAAAPSAAPSAAPAPAPPSSAFGDLSRVHAALNGAGIGMDGPLSSQILANHIRAQTAAAQGPDTSNDNSVTNHVNQTVKVDVSGVQDPEIAARMVGSHVKREFSDLTTNLKSAAQ